MKTLSKKKVGLLLVLIFGLHSQIATAQTENATAKGLVISGPAVYLPECSGQWFDQCDSAKIWFEQMGYGTTQITWPTKEEFLTGIKDQDTLVYYLASHSDSYMAKIGCLEDQMPDIIYTEEMEQALAFGGQKKLFFNMGCNSACQTDENSFARVFTSSSAEAAYIGFCGLDSDCQSCYNILGLWQSELFNQLSQQKTVGQAFELAHQYLEQFEFEYSCRGCAFLEGNLEMTLAPIEVPQELILGDINNPIGDDQCGDNIVDIFDILEEVDIILERKEITQCQFEKGNLKTGTPPNCLEKDEEIDIFDLLVIIDKTLEKENCVQD